MSLTRSKLSEATTHALGHTPLGRDTVLLHVTLDRNTPERLRRSLLERHNITIVGSAGTDTITLYCVATRDVWKTFASRIRRHETPSPYLDVQADITIDKASKRIHPEGETSWEIALHPDLDKAATGESIPVANETFQDVNTHIEACGGTPSGKLFTTGTLGHTSALLSPCMLQEVSIHPQIRSLRPMAPISLR